MESRLEAGQGYWFLVRSRESSAGGILAFSYRLESHGTKKASAAEKVNFDDFEVGGAYTRAFKVHVLSMKDKGVDDRAVQTPGRGCCGSE